jgi:hypothetical protein
MVRTKTTASVAYIAYCTNCLKKHGPPLNDNCSALVSPGGGDDVADAEDQLENVVGENDAAQQPPPLPPASEMNQLLNNVNTQAPVPVDPVASQLANMAAALNSLAMMHTTTRTEMAEMRAELASLRAPMVPPSVRFLWSHWQLPLLHRRFRLIHLCLQYHSSLSNLQCRLSGPILMLMHNWNNWSLTYHLTSQVVAFYLPPLSGV